MHSKRLPCPRARVVATQKMSYLKDVSSLRFPPSSSSDPCLLAALLALRDGGAELGRELPGEDWADRAFALRETVLLLSRACRRKSCMAGVAHAAYQKSIARGNKIQKQYLYWFSGVYGSRVW